MWIHLPMQGRQRCKRQQLQKTQWRTCPCTRVWLLPHRFQSLRELPRGLVQTQDSRARCDIHYAHIERLLAVYTESFVFNIFQWHLFDVHFAVVVSTLQFDDLGHFSWFVYKFDSSDLVASIVSSVQHDDLEHPSCCSVDSGHYIVG